MALKAVQEWVSREEEAEEEEGDSDSTEREEEDRPVPTLDDVLKKLELIRDITLQVLLLFLKALSCLARRNPLDASKGSRR